MWVDGTTWWGAFTDTSSGIYFYRRTGSTFVKGDFIDPNFSVGQPDALWNGSELFILVYQSGSLARLYKYLVWLVPEYQAATGTTVLTPTYVRLRGFPLDLRLAGFASAIALHQDSLGKLWATYTSGRDVHVIWSTSPDHRTWDTTGVTLASDIDVATDEAATLAHFDGDKIGVVWSNQALGEIGFGFRRDGDPETTWSPKEMVDCCLGAPGGVADAHLSLRAAPDGRLFLVAKDSLPGGRLHLYIRSRTGTWGQKTVVEPDPLAQPTRPILLLDVENNHAYVIYRDSLLAQRGAYVTRTSMSTPAFEPRCLVTAGNVNNPTSTKQNLNSTTDLVGVTSNNVNTILPTIIDLTSTSASVSSQAESTMVAAAAAALKPPAAPMRPALPLELQPPDVVSGTAPGRDRLSVAPTGVTPAASGAPPEPATVSARLEIRPIGARRQDAAATKPAVNGTTGLVAAAGRDQILARFDPPGPAKRTTASTPLSLDLDAASVPTPVALHAESPSVAAVPAAIALAVDGPPAAELEVIWDGALSSSRAPADDGQWRWLRGLGVSTIVNLDRVMSDFRKYGFASFLWVPLGPGEPPSDEAAARFLKFIQLDDNQPAHLSGAARDARATLVALLRYAIDGWTIDAALAEGERINGGAPLWPDQVAWLRGWAASHRPGSHRLSQERLTPWRLSRADSRTTPPSAGPLGD
jgi:hypothetical protein